MYGRETFKKLDRQVPKTMQGIRLAEQRSPRQIQIAADTERALMPHPVRGGATRNARVWLGAEHPTTMGYASIKAEERSNPFKDVRSGHASTLRKESSMTMLVLLGVVLWLAR